MINENFFLSLSPTSRILRSLLNEIKLDKDRKVFNTDLFDKYMEMEAKSISERDKTTNTIVFCNIAIMLLIFGRSINVPVINIPLSDIPAALEIVTVLSSFAFMMMAMWFFNCIIYETINAELALLKDGAKFLDPDFILASRKPFNFFLKSFRSSFSPKWPNFFEPRRPYKIMTLFIMCLFSLAIISAIILHFVCIGMSAYHTFVSNIGNWRFAYAAFLLLLNMTGIGVLITSLKSFQFDITPAGFELYAERKKHLGKLTGEALD